MPRENQRPVRRECSRACRIAGPSQLGDGDADGARHIDRGSTFRPVAPLQGPPRPTRAPSRYVTAHLPNDSAEPALEPTLLLSRVFSRRKWALETRAYTKTRSVSGTHIRPAVRKGTRASAPSAMPPPPEWAPVASSSRRTAFPAASPRQSLLSSSFPVTAAIVAGGGSDCRVVIGCHRRYHYCREVFANPARS